MINNTSEAKTLSISEFFIDRPIFAGVLSFLIFLAGIIAIFQLPISEYPEVVPPTVVVKARFPGASPQVIAETVATPLEEQIYGVENMLYMFSQSTSDGFLTLTITFRLGTDPDLAAMLVQNRVNQVLPRLPETTRQFGVTVNKSSPDLTMVVHLKSTNNNYDMLYLRNYARLNIKDQLAKIQGVAEVALFGSGDYAMRIWLNPQKLAERKLTAQDAVSAIRKQNAQVSAGTIGSAPHSANVDFLLPINTLGRLQEPEQFEEIIIKYEDGVITKLKDVARVELDASDYSLRSLLDNNFAVAIPIFQIPGSNAIDISNQIRKKMEELKESFPEGIDYSIVYDPTIFVRGSIKAVIHTLLEALGLVVLVVIIFLQTWRASIIPLLAVPVSIVGAFAVMYIFGFSINTLSLFGLVLAIGIVVDDAIVVVENVERNIEDGLCPRAATIQAMKEVTSPIIAITLVLCAVFVPISFISGLTGQFYKQFALTIAFSTVISAFNSLTLSPALSAVLLHTKQAPKDRLAKIIDKLFGWFFIYFNHFFQQSSQAYSMAVEKMFNYKILTLFIYLILLITTYALFTLVPTGFVPTQDKQYLIAYAQLPEGSVLNRTENVIKKMSEIALNHPGVESAVAFPGLSINGFINNTSNGIIFITLQPFEKRQSNELSSPAITASLQNKFNDIKEALAVIFPPAPVQGIGTIGGFKLQIEDRSDQGFEEMDKVVKEIISKANQAKELSGVFSSYKINTPQLYLDIDRVKAMQLGIDIQDIFDTLQIYLGAIYVNDFNKFGHTYYVFAQADTEFRSKPEDIIKLQVRNKDGNMTPLGSLVKVSETTGPDTAMRYNAFPSADINGGAALYYSSNQAQEAIAEILEKHLPKGIVYEWTDLTYQQILAGNTAMFVFPLCVLIIYLVLAAKYESLILPIGIISIVPLCLLSAIGGVWIAKGDNNIFTQISFFVLAGLACKNSILIVEFARELEFQGKTTISAAIEASRLRLRPILMTSFAFIMGVIPLVLSEGAGAEMRRAMGIAVFFGMLGVTFFGLFLTPPFYVMLRALEKRITGIDKEQHHAE